MINMLSPGKETFPFTHALICDYETSYLCVGVLDRQTYQGGTRGSRLCGEDRDRETENSKVCVRTRDTRFIQVRVAKVANPTSCLWDQVWRPALGVGLRSGAQLGTRPSFIKSRGRVPSRLQGRSPSRITQSES
jgi:hypothetical protein